MNILNCINLKQGKKNFYKPFFNLLLFVLILFYFSDNANAAITDKETQNIFKSLTSSMQYVRRNSLHNKMLIPHNYPLIEKFRRQYLNENGLRYLEAIMQRSVQYRTFIIEELRRENFPMELLFLPVIESGFYSKAVSKSGAAGIWQFMRNSIGGYDIHINEWLDERYDPWKTSIAAIKKLSWNYGYYNDWYLALAAYNCGVGALDKAIKKAGSKDYWYLAEHGFLKNETALYVAKFLAIAEILMQSEKYGINWGAPVPHNATETITVKRSIDLILLAEKLETDKTVFLELNPSLKFNITPPDVKYNLRVPSEHREKIEDLLAKNSLLIRYYSYRIKSGDTLYALSKHYGVSVQSILDYNPGVRVSSLKVGQTLQIPALKTVAAYSGKKNTENPSFNGSYTIKKGDTLWSIALKYKVQVEILAEKNGLDINSVLSLGRTLKVPINS
ncbi:LysM peptidoglycan-binding domain-containing protein [Treponema pedis]|nr:LysM peptidoglycan-binding domain-containing protein [Treponema pedis]